MAEGGILSAEQVHLIQSTWKICSEDMEKTGIIMFIKLFEIDPNLQDLFPFRGEVLTSETEGMKKHALGVMQTIDTAITMVLEGKIVELVAVLQELGTVHSFHNVEPQHFAPVGEALIHALSAVAQDKFTEEAKSAWVALYGVVKAKMLEGMDDDV